MMVTGPGRSLRVVVVDDDESMRRMMRRVLTRHGIAVEDFCDGRLAVERLWDGRFDCAIVDLQMPDWDGVRTAHALRAVQPGLPIIVWTGGGPPSLVARARELGPLGFFDKSCDVAEILAKLDELAGVARPL